MRSNRCARVLVRQNAWLVCISLAACNLSPVDSVDTLDDWVKQQRLSAAASVSVPALPQLPPRDPVVVSAVPADLFDSKRASLSARQVSKLFDASALLGNPLLGVPLEQMTYAGHIMQGRHRVALIRLGQRLVKARAGDLIGTQGGRITRIEDAVVHIVESARNEIGKPIVRQYTLELSSGESNVTKS